MDNSGAKNGFALLCLIGVLIIAVAAILEIRRAWRGESIISRRQLRWRVFSSVVWMLALGPLSYAVLFLWPHPKSVVGLSRFQWEASRFLSVMNGVALLFFIGLGLLMVDVLQLARERRRQAAAFERNLEDVARGELERLGKAAATETWPLAGPPEPKGGGH